MCIKVSTKALPTLSELLSLKGKRALVTGSASGIGKAIAYRFAEAGASLELVDIDQNRLQIVQDQLVTQFQGEITIHTIDLSKKEEIDALWDKIDGAEPDILVNNAGIYPFKNFLEIEDAFLNHVMEINLNSVFWMCQHMIRRKKEGGVIINIGSIEAVLPFKRDLTHYNMSKAGVMALTRALAKEYGQYGFRINAVIPGGIMTTGTKNIAKDIFKLKIGLIKTGIEFKQRLPLQRLGRPDEVALMTLVLACDLASYVQGALIPVDGGFLST